MLNDSTIARQQYTLSTGTDALSFDHYVLDADHITVWNDPADDTAPSKLVKDTDYSVSGTGDEEGNVTVTMIGQAASDKITVLRVPTMDQLLQLVFKGRIYEDSLEQGLDKLTMICLDLKEQVDRCLSYPPYEIDGWVNLLDEKADRISKTVAFNASGDLTLITSADTATLDAAIAACVASAAAAATSETNAATSETNAATSETNAATSETNAATSETNAAISESNASDSEDAAAAYAASINPSNFATAAQGALADTATQPGDNVSTLTNDAGYGTGSVQRTQFTAADARAASDVAAYADADRYGTWFRNASNPIKITDSGGDDDNFNLWPFENICYDEVNDILYVGYTSGPNRQEVGAGSTGKVAKIRKLENASQLDTNDWTNPFGSPVTIYSEVDASAAFHGLYVIQRGANVGRVVAIISRLNGDDFDPIYSIYAYSDDQGATWTATDHVKDDSGSDIDTTWFMSARQWSDGKVMMHASDYDSAAQQNNIYYWYESVDGSNVWQKIYQHHVADDDLVDQEASDAGLPTPIPWEPSWVEIGQGKALAIWRSNTTPAKLIWNITEDHGRSWTPWRLTDVDAANNPARLIYDARTDHLEILIGDRTDLTDGGVWIARTNLANALNGTWQSRSQVITTAVGNVSNLNLTAYPHLVDVGRNRLGFYYDGNGSGTASDLYMLIGTNEAKRVGLARPDKVTFPSADINPHTFGDGLIAGWYAKDRGNGGEVSGAPVVDFSRGPSGQLIVSGGSNAPSYNVAGYWEFSTDDSESQLRTYVDVNGATGTNLVIGTGQTGFIGVCGIVYINSVDQNTRRLFNLLNSENGNKYFASLRLDNSDQLGLSITADSSVGSPSYSSYADTSAIVAGSYYAVSFSLNTSTGAVDVRIDDVVEASGTLSSTDSSTIPSNLRMGIGGNNFDSNNHPPAAMRWHSLFIVSNSTAYDACNDYLTTLAAGL